MIIYINYETKFADITKIHNQNILNITNELDSKWTNILSQTENNVSIQNIIEFN